MSAPPCLLVATTNAGKVREVAAILADLGVVPRTLADLPAIPEPIEDGATFEANAQLKAVYYARRTGLLTLADDSGLVVDVLGGAPGVHSARFAGEPRSDTANNEKLISLLRGVPMADRAARFVCVVAVADRSGVIATERGEVEGVIIDEPRGAGGFGYDPHFLLTDRGRTTAELPGPEKNAISHRGRALRRIAPALRKALSGSSHPG